MFKVEMSGPHPDPHNQTFWIKEKEDKKLKLAFGFWYSFISLSLVLGKLIEYSQSPLFICVFYNF